MLCTTSQCVGWAFGTCTSFTHEWAENQDEKKGRNHLTNAGQSRAWYSNEENKINQREIAPQITGKKS